MTLHPIELFSYRELQQKCKLFRTNYDKRDSITLNSTKQTLY